MSKRSTKTDENKIIVRNRIDENLVSATVVNIDWERIILRMDISIDKCPGAERDNLEFHLASDQGFSGGKFEVDTWNENVVTVSMNITNPGNNECLPDGRYYLALMMGEDLVSLPQVAMDLIPELQYKSVTFLHGMRNKGYWVNFSVPEGDDLRLEILAQDMIVSDYEPQDRGLISGRTKHNVIRKIYSTRLKEAKKKWPDEKKTILFMSEQSEELGDNLKAVIKRMVERGLDEEFEILTSARNMVGKGHYGIRSWSNLMDKVARADQIFVDDHLPFMDWLKLDTETEVVQLWHAGAGYKSSGYSRWGHLGSPAPFSCHRQYDYGITASENIAHFFSEVFGINTEQILPTGMPRMDEYLDSDNKLKVEAKLRDAYPIINGKKVILFAPTYRGRNRKTAYYPYDLIDFDGLYDLCGEEYVVLFKMHPWVSSSVPIREEHKDRFIDMNDYPAINDLFYITDVYITDYSSGVFEFALMRKPMLFFAFDEYQYSFTRGFHRDYRSATPGKVCHTFGEILEAIRTEDFEFEKNGPYIDFHFDHLDSNSSDRVIDWFVLGGIPDELKARIDDKLAEAEATKRLDFSQCNLFE